MIAIGFLVDVGAPTVTTCTAGWSVDDDEPAPVTSLTISFTCSSCKWATISSINVCSESVRPLDEDDDDDVDVADDDVEEVCAALAILAFFVWMMRVFNIVSISWSTPEVQ